MDRVKSRAARALSRAVGYRGLVEAVDIPHWLREIALSPGEAWGGVYENVPGQRDENIAVTTHGLYIGNDGGWNFIGYTDIQSIEAPPIESPSDKLVVDSLTVHRIGGETIAVPIRGGHKKLRDVWAFLRFLMRVSEDFRRERQRTA